MTIKHTPEPWDWHNNDVYCEITSEHHGSIGDTCGSSCLGDIALGEANARRIVACVNAMAGIGDDNAIFAVGNSVRSVISNMAGKNADLERRLAELRTAAHNLEVAANTAAYCYEKRPENFASALAKLQETAEAVRGLTVETPNALIDHCYVAGGK